MKHNHPPILVLTVMGLLVGLAIAGGPIAFVLLVMAGPLLIVMFLSARAVSGVGVGSSQTRPSTARKSVATMSMLAGKRSFLPPLLARTQPCLRRNVGVDCWRRPEPRSPSGRSIYDPSAQSTNLSSSNSRSGAFANRIANETL
jgi:phosphatidylglycerophosphate synthase